MGEKQDYARSKTFLAAETPKELVLNFKSHRPAWVGVYAEATGAAIITVEVSIDGESWREIDSFNITGALPAFNNYEGSWQYFRLSTPVLTADVTLEIGG